MLTFNLRFFLLSILFFVIEVLIALYVKDDFVRPYVGDYLVVMLIYCAVRTFIKASPVKVAIAVLLFAYLIEEKSLVIESHIDLEEAIISDTKKLHCILSNRRFSYP